MSSDTKLDKHTEKEKDDFLKLVKAIDDPILIVLRVHLYVEQLIERIISCELPRGDRLLDKTNFTFAQKLSIVASFDIIEDDLLTSIKHLNSVRNKCAHNLNNDISMSDIDLIGRPFGKFYSKIRRENIGNNVKTLIYVCIQIGGRLARETMDAEQNAHDRCD